MIRTDCIRIAPFLWIPFLIALLTCGSAVAQDDPAGLEEIRLGSMELSLPISGQARIYIDTASRIETSRLRNLPAFSPIPIELSRKIPARYVTKPCFLQFRFRNDTDSAKTVFLLPGFYFSQINLFKYDSAGKEFKPISSRPANPGHASSITRGIEMEAGEAATFLAELNFVKTTVNTITPVITSEAYLPHLLSQFQNERRLNNIITYLVCGVMMMMVFYSLAFYFANRNREFLYYTSYAALLAVMFFFKAYLYKYPLDANYFFESYFDFILQGSGVVFYYLFLRRFTNASQDFPLLEKMLGSLQAITITGLLLFTYLNFFSGNFSLQYQVENGIKYVWSFSTIFFIAYALYVRKPILQYLALGHTFLFAGGLLSLFLISSAQRFSPSLTSLINDSLFWYEMGIMLELVFFLAALSFKNRQDISARAREKERLLLENEKVNMEKKMAILAAKQEERNRISADMHDELGSGVTAIRLLSELVKAKMKGSTLPEIDKISNSANELISKMNTIIWTMKSSNDSVDNMIAYVRSYSSEFFDNTDIICRVESPDNLPAIDLSGEKRQNCFLCIKEALNNIVKHAEATEVLITFKIGPHLVVQIRDNGIGLRPDNMREFSSGLTNMRKRMESVNGHFSIRNQNGTVVTLSIPLE